MDSELHARPLVEVPVFTRVRQSVAAVWASWVGDAALLLVLGAVMTAVHLYVPGTVPSGGDGGNWLALAAERFGDGVMSAQVTYPPLFPVLLGVVKAFVSDGVVAIVTLGLLSKITLVVGAYICARTLGRVYAVFAAVLVGAGGALFEAYAWGGYPQLMAMGFGLLATFMVLGYLNTWQRRHLILGLVFSAATLLTHTMIGGLLGLALVTAVFHVLYMTDPRSGERARSLRVGLLVAGPILVFAIFGFLDGTLSGFQPTINPIGLSRLESIVAAVNEAPYPWAILALAGLSVLFFRFWPDHVATTIAVGSSWLTTSVALFLVSGEPRALLVTQVALILLAVVGFAAAFEFLRPSGVARHSPSRLSGLGHRVLLVLGISLVAALVAGGLSRYGTATDWYRVVDHAEIAALDHFNEISQPGDLVIAATGHHGNPVGWWVEGYAGRSTYTAVNVNFLAFPDERQQSELATSFFEDGYSLQESVDTLTELGADYVVVDKRGPDAFWLDGEVARAFTVVDDTSNLVMLRAPAETR